jgi:hypothetical protein
MLQFSMRKDRATIESRLAEVNRAMAALRDPDGSLRPDNVEKWVALFNERNGLERLLRDDDLNQP